MKQPIRPPFTEETARAKVKAAEDAWNTRDPERVALAYTEDSQWRNRTHFFTGREAIKEFLSDETVRTEVEIILGRAYVDAYRYVRRNMEAVKATAKFLEENGDEVEGGMLRKFYSELEVDTDISPDDDWPDIFVKSPYYEGEKGRVEVSRP